MALPDRIELGPQMGQNSIEGKLTEVAKINPDNMAAAIAAGVAVKREAATNNGEGQFSITSVAPKRPPTVLERLRRRFLGR